MSNRQKDSTGYIALQRRYCSAMQMPPMVQLHDSNYGQAQTGVARSSALKRLPTNLNFESPANVLAAGRQRRRFPPARISTEIGECDIAGRILGE
jgi:hypothetical protein